MHPSLYFTRRMQLIAFRWYFLLVAIAITGPALGQPPVQVDSVSTVFKMEAGQIWSKKKTRTIQRRPIPATDVFRDIPLRRLKSVTTSFPPVSAGDTLRVTAFSKTGVPFKSIRLTLDQKTLVELQDTAAFQYETVSPGAGTPTLTLRQKLNPRIQTAAVHLQYTPPAQFDTLYSNQDVLIATEQSGTESAIFRKSVMPFDGNEILTYWKGTIPTDRPNEVIHRTQKLTIDNKPPLRSWLQPSRIVRLRNLKKTEIVYNTGFQRGDTLIFEVKAMGKSVIRHGALLDQDSKIRRSVRDVTAFADTAVVQHETAFKLSLQGKLALKKKFAQVTILRIRPVVPDSFYVVTDSLFRIQETPVYDTLVFNIFDDSLELNPIWNIEKTPVGEFKVQVPRSGPKLGNLSHIVYWLGIGRPALHEFQRLEVAVPPEWSRPGVFASLGALGFGRKLVFKEQYPPEVRFACTTPEDRKRFRAGKKLLSNAPIANMQKQSYGLVRSSALLSGLKQSIDPKTGISTSTFYVCFENKSTVSPFPVSLRLVGFYLLKTSETKTNEWLKTEIYKDPVRK